MRIVNKSQGDKENVFVRELVGILKGVAEGLISIPFPPQQVNKPEWLRYCKRCNRYINPEYHHYH